MGVGRVISVGTNGFTVQTREARLIYVDASALFGVDNGLATLVCKGSRVGMYAIPAAE